MATPTTDEGWRLAGEAVKRWRAHEDQVLRDLLGRWVSELEPQVIYGYGTLPTIKGVGFVGDPAGRVMVRNPEWRPGVIETLYERGGGVWRTFGGYGSRIRSRRAP